jgi:hypothetical protein
MSGKEAKKAAPAAAPAPKKNKIPPQFVKEGGIVKRRHKSGKELQRTLLSRQKRLTSILGLRTRYVPASTVYTLIKKGDEDMVVTIPARALLNDLALRKTIRLGRAAKSIMVEMGGKQMQAKHLKSALSVYSIEGLLPPSLVGAQ